MSTRRIAVSVLIAGGGAVQQAAMEQTIRSVRSQTFPGVEMLVCPPDQSAAWWTIALARTRGEYICCLLPGDQLAPTYLELCLFRMAVEGLDVISALEDPSDHLPHIYVVRKSVLQAAGGFDAGVPPATQRLGFIQHLEPGYVRGEISDCLARPADPPAMAGEMPSYPAAVSGQYSYSGVISGKHGESPTVLLSMPFLTMGGAEAAVSQLCAHLKRLGFRLLVYTTTTAPAESHGDTSAWFEPSVAGIFHLPRALDAAHWAAFLAYLIEQHGISVLWLVGSDRTYDLLPLLRELFPQLAVVDLLFNTEGHAANSVKHKKHIDRVVVEHRGMKEWLMRQGEPAERVSVIPNGIDVSLYDPQAKLDWRTLAPRQSDAPFVVAFFGRLSKEKAPDAFLEIAARLASRPECQFLIGGIGPMEPLLRERAEVLGIAGRVHFLGFVSTADYLACSDVVVVCSRLDGRPNIVMESMAMAVPVVASKVGGIPEMFPPGDEDLLCAPADAGEFAAAIGRLADDPERCRRSAEAVRRHAEQNFPSVENGRRFAELFEELRQQRRRHATLPAAEIAARLGYRETYTPDASRLRREQGATTSILGPLRNAVLLWKIQRGGRMPLLRKMFDPDFYKLRYANSGSHNRALFDYLFKGFRQGRNPSADFDTCYYLSLHEDVERAGLNPLLHYVMWGIEESRVTKRERPPEGPPRRFSQSGS